MGQDHVKAFRSLSSLDSQSKASSSRRPFGIGGGARANLRPPANVSSDRGRGGVTRCGR